MAHVSKYRFVKAEIARPDKHFLNISPTGAIWDCANFIAASSEYMAVPWQQLGSVLVMRHDTPCKLGSPPPLLYGHSGNVIDVQFSPFNPSLLLTASEDTTLRGWAIPEGGVQEKTDKCLFKLEGHHKKCGIMAFHPSADRVLASASADGTVKLWDLEAATCGATFRPREEPIMSLNWNLDGSLLCTTTKDKSVTIMDSRTGVAVVSAHAHDGNKTQRSVWAKRKNLIVTTGFTSKQHREAKVWDPRHMDQPLHREEIDQQSAIIMPFLDEDLGILYLAGKGDGSIRYYELGGSVPLVAANSYTSNEPQKGLCMLPKTSLNLHSCEIARFLKIGAKSIFPIPMIMPRRSAEFEEEVYPPTFALTPALSAKQFFDGRNAQPLTQDMRPVYDGVAPTAVSASARPTISTPAAAPKTEEKPKETEVPAPTKEAPATSTEAPKQVATTTAASSAPTTANDLPHAAPSYIKKNVELPSAPAWDEKTTPSEELVESQRQYLKDVAAQLAAAREQLATLRRQKH